jgi:hypothetical protein
MSRRQVDLKLVQTAYVLTNRSVDRREADILQQFKHVVYVVNKTYKALPWDNEDDPGALYEFDTFLKNCNHQANSLLTEALNVEKPQLPHDLRLLRAQEALREAFHVAYSSKRGFRGIGRPPELQQLIAVTCLDVYAAHLLWAKVRAIGSLDASYAGVEWLESALEKCKILCLTIGYTKSHYEKWRFIPSISCKSVGGAGCR